MSLPKLSSSPALSSHPSKQSLRCPPSRPQSIDRVAHTTDNPDEYQSQHIGTDVEPHPEVPEQDVYTHHGPPSHPHTLSQPFFTLIEDAHTSEYYHPTVHYIFSDDDTDIVTEAALRSLESEQDAAPNTTMKGKSRAVTSDQTAKEPYDDNELQARKESLLPDPIPGVRDNYIILDIDHIPPLNAHESARPSETQGQVQAQVQTITTTPCQQQPDPYPNPTTQDQPHQLSITSAHSLSSSWQVLNTQLLPAPTFENNPPTEKPANGGLMLQIQGTSGLPVGVLRDRERGGQRLEDMMDQFARRLDELRMVIESGERGIQAKTEAEEEAGVNVGASVHGHDASPLEGPGAQDEPSVAAAGEGAGDVQSEEAVRGGQDR